MAHFSLIPSIIIIWVKKKKGHLILGLCWKEVWKVFLSRFSSQLPGSSSFSSVSTEKCQKLDSLHEESWFPRAFCSGHVFFPLSCWLSGPAGVGFCGWHVPPGALMIPEVFVSEPCPAALAGRQLLWSQLT